MRTLLYGLSLLIAAPLCFLAPIGFALSLASSLQGRQSIRPPQAAVLELIAAGGLSLAALIALFNIYVAIIRPRMQHVRDRDPGGHVSGLPLIGTVCLLPAAVCSHGVPEQAIAGLLFSAVDVGGLPWLWIAMVMHSDLWKR